MTKMNTTLLEESLESPENLFIEKITKLKNDLDSIDFGEFKTSVLVEERLAKVRDISKNYTKEFLENLDDECFANTNNYWVYKDIISNAEIASKLAILISIITNQKLEYVIINNFLVCSFDIYEVMNYCFREYETTKTVRFYGVIKTRKWFTDLYDQRKFIIFGSHLRTDSKAHSWTQFLTEEEYEYFLYLEKVSD